jgi:ribosomal protein S18 acetylase RimI-like enzyme
MGDLFNMDEIKKLSELNEEQINQAISVFVDGFFNVFSSISKDKKKLHKLFKHSFKYEMAYAYLQDGEAVGILGLADYQTRALKLNKEILMEILPGFAGKVTYKMVHKALETPHPIKSQEIFIDYIATNPKCRSKGIGTQLFEFVRKTLRYKHIELEVFSKNPRAKALYEKLGFKVITKRRDFLMILQGFGRRIVMRCEAE